MRACGTLPKIPLRTELIQQENQLTEDVLRQQTILLIPECEQMNQQIYSDIALRTQGDIYIGVVGPVRTGKSTFIKRFMDTMVIPNIDGEYQRERATDELPQSAAGVPL